MTREEHWIRVYGDKHATEVSWYAPHLVRSLTMIEAVADAGSRIIDVGGGASTLVDDLLDRGHTEVSVLDLSSSALAVAQERLGDRAARVGWIAGDVTRTRLPEGGFDLWHDRAVFHFLTEPEDRRAYVELASTSLEVGGHVVLATFAEDGPVRCSGLEVVRYSAERLDRELGPGFRLRQAVHESHHTPSGAEQQFIYCRFERVAATDSGPAHPV
jgi:SAM-dependent methyltransferase